MSGGSSWLALVLTLLSQGPFIRAQLGVSQDPCTNHVCKWGEMCKGDAFGFPTCICPISCTYSTIPACSTYGLEFPSECEMHRFACAHSISIAMNKGKCRDGPRSEMCPNRDELMQFRDRYLEWMYGYKELQDDPFFKPEKRIYQLSINEKMNAVKWMFGMHDQDKNDLLDDREMKALLNWVMVHEPCGPGFIKSCAMVDKQPGINQEEWNICFNIAERPFDRRH